MSARADEIARAAGLWRERGVVWRTWARDRGVDYPALMDVLRGRCQGRRGKAFGAASALLSILPRRTQRGSPMALFDSDRPDPIDLWLALDPDTQAEMGRHLVIWLLAGAMANEGVMALPGNGEPLDPDVLALIEAEDMARMAMRRFTPRLLRMLACPPEPRAVRPVPDLDTTLPHV